MNWYNVINDPATKTAHVIIGDDIGCGGASSGDLARELDKIEPDRVELLINSRGGNALSGLNVHSIIRQYECTVAVISGNCWSSAVPIAMAASKIRIEPTAKILIHPPVSGGLGTPIQLREEADRLEKLTGFLHRIIRERTGQPDAVVSAWLAQDTWFDAERALALGIVDEIISRPVRHASAPAVTTPASGQRPTQTEDEKLFACWLTAFGRMTVSNRAEFHANFLTWLHQNVNEL